ncbi:hypothetical protein F2P79_022002 [Pimephales promelas]|nr:hypothetical protein F2P79_022002 [Pimephales promelas]
MALIKEESEDMRIADTEEQAELMKLKEDSEEQWDFINGEKPRETEKTKSNSHLTCDQCGKRRRTSHMKKQLTSPT